MNSSFARFKDARIIREGEDQFLLIEFNDGKIRQFTAKEIYEATWAILLRPIRFRVPNAEPRKS